VIFFPPFGMLLGAFAGALAGEMIEGKRGGDASRAAWGVFIGTVAGIVMKLSVSGIITWFWIREVLA
jgi:uncharacterized protein YqgC (DUF456 family)